MDAKGITKSGHGKRIQRLAEQLTAGYTLVVSLAAKVSQLEAENARLSKQATAGDTLMLVIRHIISIKYEAEDMEVHLEQAIADYQQAVADSEVNPDGR